MEAVQTQSPLAFSRLPPAPRTLGDLRMSQNDYASAGSASANSMRPLLIVAALIVVGAGIAWGLNKSPENVAAPTVPAAASLPVTNDIPVATPLIPVAKSEEVSPVPSAAAGDSRSSESVKPVKPVKANSVAAVKAAPVAAKKAAPIPTAPVIETAAPAPEVAPPAAIVTPAAPPAPVTPAAPAAIVIEEKPAAPPVEPPPQ